MSGAALKLDRVVIEGFKSIVQCDLRLGQLNFLVGPNGSGKSNLIQALGFTSSILTLHMQPLMENLGGSSVVVNARSSPSGTLECGLNFRLETELQDITLSG